MTDKQAVADPPKAGKDKHWEHVPRYTIKELLNDPVKDAGGLDEGSIPDEFMDLPAAML